MEYIATTYKNDIFHSSLFSSLDIYPFCKWWRNVQKRLNPLTTGRIFSISRCHRLLSLMQCLRRSAQLQVLQQHQSVWNRRQLLQLLLRILLLTLLPTGLPTLLPEMTIRKKLVENVSVASGSDLKRFSFDLIKKSYDVKEDTNGLRKGLRMAKPILSDLTCSTYISSKRCLHVLCFLCIRSYYLSCRW